MSTLISITYLCTHNIFFYLSQIFPTIYSFIYSLLYYIQICLWYKLKLFSYLEGMFLITYRVRNEEHLIKSLYKYIARAKTVIKKSAYQFWACFKEYCLFILKEIFVVIRASYESKTKKQETLFIPATRKNARQLRSKYIQNQKIRCSI